VARFLAAATAADGTVVGGARGALHVGERVLPWEVIRAATWDADTATLAVETTADTIALVFGDGAERLLALVRERITASVVLQRPFPGGRVVARRGLTGERTLVWQVEYDAAVPTSQAEAAATAALARARADVGL
jgi:hypothetical protein